MPDTASLGPASLALVESWPTEDDVLTDARSRAQEIGVAAVSRAVGATLRVLATVTGARAAVEVGTGAGVSGLLLLRGMAPGGVLTTVDVESEHQRAAKQTFTAAGIATNRFRLINGSGAEVLPRLTDGGYDLVVIDADPTGYPGYFEQAMRLLRVGGVVAFVGALAGDRVADGTKRDPQTVALREIARMVQADERVAPALLPVGSGLLLAARL